MKKLFGITLLLIASALTTSLFAQSTDYEKFMKRAKSYEEKNYWIFAMADYYQAMEAEPTALSEDAYKRFYEIRDAIASGAPAPSDAFNIEESDEFEIHDRWAFLYKEYNSFWSKHSPVSFNFTTWEQDELNYETKTAKYHSDVSVYWSKMYNIIHDAIYEGYRTSYRDDWTDLDVSWNADVKELSSYSLVFNLSDANGNDFALNQEIKTQGYRKPYYISNVPKELMKQFNNNQIKVTLVQVKINDKPTKISLKDIHVQFPDGTGHLDENITDKVSHAIYERDEQLAEEQLKLEEEQKKLEEEAALLAIQDEFRKKSPKMIKIESGSFTMGRNSPDFKNNSNEKDPLVNQHPAHEVSLAGYKISATEVTQKQFIEVMGYNPSQYKNDKNPVENVSWYDAIAFCNKASIIKGLKPCYSINGETNPDLWEYTEQDSGEYEYYYSDGDRWQRRIMTRIYTGELKCNFNRSGYRLPTEAEWEYAASEGSTGSKYTYSGSDNLIEVAWCKDNCTEPHPVAKRLPNALGLYDMTGNLAEFCWDSYHKEYYEYSSANNPKGPDAQKYTRKVIRGGSYLEAVGNKTRNSVLPGSYSTAVGIRLVQSTEKRTWNDQTPEEKVAAKKEDFLKNGPSMILVSPSDSKAFYMGTYEIAQYEWEAITGKNPSKFSYDLTNPVEGVTYYDCLYFCNKLSERFGYTPCYEIDGNIHADEWDYNTTRENTKSKKVTCNYEANGFRLPTEKEYSQVIKKINLYTYEAYYYFNTTSGWLNYNSKERTHPCGTSKPDGNGFYDLNGNVTEMCETNQSGIGTSILGRKRDNDVFYESKQSDAPIGLRLVRSGAKE